MGFPNTPRAPCRLIHLYNSVSLLLNIFNGEGLARETSPYNFFSDWCYWFPVVFAPRTYCVRGISFIHYIGDCSGANFFTPRLTFLALHIIFTAPKFSIPQPLSFSHPLAIPAS